MNEKKLLDDFTDPEGSFQVRVQSIITPKNHLTRSNSDVEIFNFPSRIQKLQQMKFGTRNFVKLEFSFSSAVGVSTLTTPDFANMKVIRLSRFQKFQ